MTPTVVLVPWKIWTQFDLGSTSSRCELNQNTLFDQCENNAQRRSLIYAQLKYVFIYTRDC